MSYHKLDAVASAVLYYSALIMSVVLIAIVVIYSGVMLAKAANGEYDTTTQCKEVEATE